jgi:tetratricopeptide (TPR) repeat protein
VLGICLLALERPDEAIETFTRAVNVDPENGVTRRNLGNALFDRGDNDAAAVHAEEGVRLRIDDPGAWDLLGRVSAVKGDLPAAQADFARALRLDPNFSEAREHLQAVEKLLARSATRR